MNDDRIGITMKTNPHVFLIAGEAENAPGLRAARCGQCGKFTLGRVMICSHCFSREVTEVAAGQEAELIEFSVAHVSAGGFEAPYAIGQLRTSEGMTLFAPLLGDAGELTPGTRVAFTTLDRGDGLLGFAFQRPGAGAA